MCSTKGLNCTGDHDFVSTHPPVCSYCPFLSSLIKHALSKAELNQKAGRLLMSNNKNSSNVLHSKLLQQMGPALPVCSHSACDDRTKISALSTPETEVHKGGRVKVREGTRGYRPVSSVSRVKLERWWHVAEIKSLCCNMRCHNRICYIKKRDYPILLSVRGHKAEYLDCVAPLLSR